MKIIIQQTEDGLKVVYPLKYDEYAAENKPYQYFLNDEAHIADYADAFSVQMANGKKVYSLISSDIKDYLGRAGSFFAIRIFLNENENIEQVFKLLKEIKTRYVDHYVNKKMASLSFDDLIANYKSTRTENTGVETIAIGFKKNAYAFIENTNLTASTFETEVVKAVQSVYLFNKEKTSEGVYSRMQALEKLKNIRKIDITPNNLLKGLKVNDALVENYPKDKNFRLLVIESAAVSYQQKGESFKPLSKNRLNLTPPPSPPRNPGTSTPKKDKIITYSLLGICFAFLIGGILFFQEDLFFETPIIENELPSTKPEIVESGEVTNGIGDTLKVEPTKKVVFTKNSANEFKISIPQGLEYYSFKHAGGKWSYKNSKGKDKYVDFYTEIIGDILKNDLKNDFKTELETLSGEEIKDKTKPKAKKSTSKKSTTKKGKSKAKPKPAKNPKKEKEVNTEDVGEGVDI